MITSKSYLAGLNALRGYLHCHKHASIEILKNTCYILVMFNVVVQGFIQDFLLGGGEQCVSAPLPPLNLIC